MNVRVLDQPLKQPAGRGASPRSQVVQEKKKGARRSRIRQVGGRPVLPRRISTSGRPLGGSASRAGEKSQERRTARRATSLQAADAADACVRQSVGGRAG